MLSIIDIIDYPGAGGIQIRRIYSVANLAEREESRSSFCLSNVERSKNTDEKKMPIYFTF